MYINGKQMTHTGKKTKSPYRAAAAPLSLIPKRKGTMCHACHVTSLLCRPGCACCVRGGGSGAGGGGGVPVSSLKAGS